MILIDTSAWIEFFRKSGDLSVKRKVAEYIERDEAAYTCPIYFELLAGARDHEKPVIDEALSLCERQLFKKDYWVKAANLENKLRKKGTTIPRDDLFVAIVAVENQIPILCMDRHFDMIRDKAKLNLKIQQMTTS